MSGSAILLHPKPTTNPNDPLVHGFSFLYLGGVANRATELDKIGEIWELCARYALLASCLCRVSFNLNAS